MLSAVGGKIWRAARAAPPLPGTPPSPAHMPRPVHLPLTAAAAALTTALLVLCSAPEHAAAARASWDLALRPVPPDVVLAPNAAALAGAAPRAGPRSSALLGDDDTARRSRTPSPGRGQQTLQEGRHSAASPAASPNTLPHEHEAPPLADVLDASVDAWPVGWEQPPLGVVVG